MEWGVSSWEAMIPAVAQGQYDIGMDGITINAERDEQIDFSDPYMTSRQFMLVRADEDRFTTPEEFAADESLLVGAQTGTTGFYTAIYDILDGDEANPRVIIIDDFGATVQALISGDIDLVLVDCGQRAQLHRRQPRRPQDRRRSPPPKTSASSSHPAPISSNRSTPPSPP
ncbi:MAG: transporter substrate-binding domain-containing protein [Caldilineaceae bacterium]